MSNQLADPAALSWPATLPIEVALKTTTVEDILDAYELTFEEYENLLAHPAFIREVAAATEALREEGMSFFMKNRLQAEAMLSRLWQMTHASFDEVPAKVQADLLMFSIRCAGLDRSREQSKEQQGTPLQILINLS
jgi:hypothetical protein